MKRFTIWWQTETNEDSIFIEAEELEYALEDAEDMLPAGAVITDIFVEDLEEDEDDMNPPDSYFSLGLHPRDFIQI